MALQLQTTHHKVHSNFLYLLAASAKLSPDEMPEELKYWDEIQGQEDKNHPLPVHKSNAGNDKRLRVGYVSHDLRTHAVSRFDIYCYDTM